MNDQTRKIIETIGAMSPRFSALIEKAIANFGSLDEVPLLILSFLGAETAVLYRESDISLIRRVLQLAEREMEAGDEFTATAISTGFLEGFWIRVENVLDESERTAIAEFLGPESAGYLKAWSDQLGAPFP